LASYLAAVIQDFAVCTFEVFRLDIQDVALVPKVCKEAVIADISNIIPSNNIEKRLLDAEDQVSRSDIVLDEYASAGVLDRGQRHFDGDLAVDSTRHSWKIRLWRGIIRGTLGGHGDIAEILRHIVDIGRA
jgi:hypothetical protein